MKLTIDEIAVDVPENSTILDAANAAGVHIPTLCFLKDCAPIGACRVCMVEVEGVKKPVPACATAVREGMVVKTNTAAIREYRKMTLDLICRNHRMECEFCPRYSDCELIALMVEHGLTDKPYMAAYHAARIDDSDPVISFDPSKCVGCRRCVSVCPENILGIFGRGADAHAAPYAPLNTTKCTHCGECIAVCPVGAVYDTDVTNKIWKAIWTHKNIAAVVSAETRLDIGNAFSEEPGTDNTEKLAAVLRKLGFRMVYGGEGINTLSEAGELARKDGAEFTVLMTGDPSKKLDNDENTIAITTRELAAFIRRASTSRYTAVKVWRETKSEKMDSLGTEAARSTDIGAANGGRIQWNNRNNVKYFETEALK